MRLINSRKTVVMRINNIYSVLKEKYKIMRNPLKRNDMKTNYPQQFANYQQQEPNLKSFYEFAKMNNNEKSNLLLNKGLLLDEDCSKDEAINLYYLNGFFVEETILRKQGKVKDIIPYKHGYRLKTFTDIKPTNIAVIRKKES